MALHDPRPLDLTPDEETGGGASEPRTRFGRYLLFKRLKKDALGEIHRAGQLGSEAIERVVSLRLFNAAEIDGLRFRSACEARDGVQSCLRGGPFGEVVDFGCENGIAFVAHEFVCGRSLAELLVQARERHYPVPLDQTLHLMDRIAIGLQNAYETRLDETRIIHGFLVPDFVHLSSEGEVRLTGFESTGGLLELNATGPARSALAGYISPEVNAGQPTKASDDVYSLGSIFGELLTGEPLPALNPAESSRWAESAMLAAEAAPLPDKIRLLLRESLLPRDQRIQTAEQWHKALVDIMTAEAQSSTTFDVAFFMHTLFGEELDREAEVVKAEMEADIPPAPEPVEAAVEPPTEGGDEFLEPVSEAAEQPPTLAERLTELTPPSALESPSEPAIESPPELAFEDESEPPPPAKPLTNQSKVQAAAEETSPHRLIAAGAIALVAVLGGGAYYFFGPPSREAPAPIQVTAAPRVDPLAQPADVAPNDIETAIAEVAPPLSPEELQSQVRSLVAQRAGDLEANLKAEYDQRLVELRRQLEDARTAPTAEPEPEAAAAVAPPQTARTQSKPAAEPAAAEKTPASTVGTPPVASPTPALTPPPPVEKPVVAPEPVVEQPVAANPRAAQPAPAEVPAREPDPEPTAVEPGSIVTPGPGVASPTLLRQPRAVYPPAAARLKRQATVRVRILVDETGKPVEIEQVGKKVGLGFDGAALRAAKQTLWTPPQKGGVPVKMWVELSIDFRP